MKTGEWFIDRFIERVGHSNVYFEKRGRIKVGDIRRFIPHTTDRPGEGAKSLRP